MSTLGEQSQDQLTSSQPEPTGSGEAEAQRLQHVTGPSNGIAIGTALSRGSPSVQLAGPSRPPIAANATNNLSKVVANNHPAGYSRSAGAAPFNGGDRLGHPPEYQQPMPGQQLHPFLGMRQQSLSWMQRLITQGKLPKAPAMFSQTGSTAPRWIDATSLPRYESQLLAWFSAVYFSGATDLLEAEALISLDMAGRVLPIQGHNITCITDNIPLQRIALKHMETDFMVLSSSLREREIIFFITLKHKVCHL